MEHLQKTRYTGFARFQRRLCLLLAKKLEPRSAAYFSHQPVFGVLCGGDVRLRKTAVGFIPVLQFRAGPESGPGLGDDIAEIFYKNPVPVPDLI